MHVSNHDHFDRELAWEFSYLADECLTDALVFKARVGEVFVVIVRWGHIPVNRDSNWS